MNQFGAARRTGSRPQGGMEIAKPIVYAPRTHRMPG